MSPTVIRTIAIGYQFAIAAAILVGTSVHRQVQFPPTEAGSILYSGGPLSDFRWAVPVIQAGEWVTHPDGSRVCQVSHTIFRVNGPPTAWVRAACSSWTEALPPYGAPVARCTFDWIDVDQQGIQRIHIGDKWVPGPPAVSRICP